MSSSPTVSEVSTMEFLVNLLYAVAADIYDGISSGSAGGSDAPAQKG